MREAKLFAYERLLREMDEVAGRQLPPDTPVKYFGGVLSGWEDYGYRLAMTVFAGDCELGCNLSSMYGLDVLKGHHENMEDRGIQLLEETTLGNAVAFSKYLEIAKAGNVLS